MRIRLDELRAQFDRTAGSDWIRDVENGLVIPPYLLYALGSRETNLNNVRSKDGHGWGIWQRDDRSFSIPLNYLETPEVQAYDAGMLLMSHVRFFAASYPEKPVWLSAVCAYNAGRTGVRRKLDAGLSPQTATTGGDYGSDVLERWSCLLTWGWPKV